MPKTVLVIHPDVKVGAKDLRALSESYVVLRCLPSAVSAPDLGADATTVSVALEMLASTNLFVEPVAWRSYLAKKFVDRVRKQRGDT